VQDEIMEVHEEFVSVIIMQNEECKKSESGPINKIKKNHTEIKAWKKGLVQTQQKSMKKNGCVDKNK